MKLSSGFRMRRLGAEHIVTAEGAGQVNFNKMISLNSSAAYLWQAVEGKEFTVEELADLLVEKYEIDRETALRDSAVLAEKWIEAGIAEK